MIAANPEEMKELIKADAKNADLTDAQINDMIQKQMAEKLKTAQTVLAEVQKNPAQFAKVAKEKSEDVESAKMGGDLGFFAKKKWLMHFQTQHFQ